MTPEQRYEEIDERLRNVAMHLEVTASMVHTHDEQIAKILNILSETGQTMKRLANIADAHEQRIEDLEGRRQ